MLQPATYVTAVASFRNIRRRCDGPNSCRLQVELGKNAKRISFTTSDLENLKGSYDTVLCIDVMIHYPTEKARNQPPVPAFGNFGMYIRGLEKGRGDHGQ